ncbi:unnamed protein product [Clavelina lepadiformis]|uniref:PKD/REJ-like domain-containing protein n=1 Tax=Clavelina lepadiformis TaxID=159417 RepID=A0ABP0GA98_CLALP
MRNNRFVSLETSQKLCRRQLESVRIRDGKVGGGLDEHLKVVEKLVLSANLDFRCLRVVNANVTSDEDLIVLAKGDDFTLVEIPKRKLNFLINGGDVVEAGSCFDWKTLWVSGNDTLEISRNKLIPSEQYYVRLIISGPHYDATFADQKIVAKSKSAPIVILRCWSNCEKLFSSHKPIILQLECDDCIRHTWELSLKSAQKMSLCKDQRFCKLNKSILNKIKTSLNVTGTGYNIDGDKASATLILAPLIPPSGGICKVHPRSGIAYVTKFNVTCHGYAQDRVPLKYKFFTVEKAQGSCFSWKKFGAGVKQTLDRVVN